MNIRKTAAIATLGLCSMVGVVAYRVGRARADGAPTISPLHYGGVLEDGGRPVEGMRNVTVRLWDMAMGGTATCTTVAPNTPFAAGRFRVELDAACTGAVRANPNLWAEVLVDSTTFPRQKLAAVPYALEASRAAGASGALEARIAAVEALAQPRQVEVGPPGRSINSIENATIADPATTFTITPRTTGIFSISSNCSIAGAATLSIVSVSSPAPVAFRNFSTAINSVVTSIPTVCVPSSPGNAPYLCISPPNLPIYRIVATAVLGQAQAFGTLQSGVSYTFQVSARFLAVAGGSIPFASTVLCGPITVTQLN